MDVPRTGTRSRRWLRRGTAGMAAVVLLSAAVFGLKQLQPPLPTVSRSMLVIDTVQRGLMLREVRGPGRLVPEESLWITVSADGRVEKIPLQPGVMVTAETVLVELNNPQLDLEALDAYWASRSAEAELTSQRARIQNHLLEMEAALARERANLEEARLQHEVDEQLFKDDLISEHNLRLSAGRVEQLAHLIKVNEERLKINRESVDAQLAVQEAAVERAKALANLKRWQVESLKVTAGVDGILEQLNVEVGQRVSGGTILAKVTNPQRLKAQLRIQETQARDVQIGQSVVVDLRTAKIPGVVVRVDPSVDAGTVTVDVALEGELPRGARPDLSVDGTIEVERLENVLYVGRPVYGQPESAATVLKITDSGAGAARVQVTFGRSSVSTIEVVQGLAEGDQIILSDISEWESSDLLRVR